MDKFNDTINSTDNLHDFVTTTDDSLIHKLVNSMDTLSAGNGLPSEWVRQVIVVYMCLIIIIGIPGNGLVILVQSKKQKKSSTDNYVLLMAAIDFCCSSVVAPVYIVRNLGAIWISVSSDTICKFHIFLTFENSAASVLLLAALAYERYRITCHPTLNDTGRVGKSRSVCIAIIIFSLTFAACSLPMMHVNKRQYKCTVLPDFKSAYSVMMNVVAVIFVGMFITVVVCYTKVSIFLRKRYRIMAKQRLTEHVPSQVTENHGRKESNLIVMTPVVSLSTSTNSKTEETTSGSTTGGVHDNSNTGHMATSSTSSTVPNANRTTNLPNKSTATKRDSKESLKDRWREWQILCVSALPTPTVASQFGSKNNQPNTFFNTVTLVNRVEQAKTIFDSMVHNDGSGYQERKVSSSTGNGSGYQERKVSSSTGNGSGCPGNTSSNFTMAHDNGDKPKTVSESTKVPQAEQGSTGLHKAAINRTEQDNPISKTTTNDDAISQAMENVNGNTTHLIGGASNTKTSKPKLYPKTANKTKKNQICPETPAVTASEQLLESTTARNTAENRNINRVTLMMFVITTFYICTWLLNFSLGFMRDNHSQATIDGRHLIKHAFMINCVSNPIFYISMSSKFREQAKCIFTKSQLM